MAPACSTSRDASSMQQNIKLPAPDHSRVKAHVHSAWSLDVQPGLILARNALFLPIGGDGAERCGESRDKNDGGELWPHGAMPLAE